MTRVAVATPGSDSPGTNACIRSVVKHATHEGLEVVGIRNGALGLLRSSDDDYFPLTSSSLANQINRSGTILKSSRQDRFDEYLTQVLGDELVHGQTLSLSTDLATAVGELGRVALQKNDIDALILIGGDTTSRAAIGLSKAYEGRFPIVVIPASIDNDIRGTAETIGFDSAVAMAVAQVDAIRETAPSIDRIFVVEVMGAKRGFIAVDVAMAAGAEVVLIPEIDYTAADIQSLVSRLARRAEDDRASAIVIVAEGARLPSIPGVDDDQPGRALVQYLAEAAPRVEVQLSVLGHVLRGAPPTARTRNLAAKAGGLAVTEILGQLATLQKSKRPGACAPTLIGIHSDGFDKHVEITGDMVRDDRVKLIRTVEDEIAVLGF